MTYKQIEASREIRLWITQIVVPAIGIAMLFPEVRKTVAEKAKDVGNKIKSQLHK